MGKKKIIGVDFDEVLMDSLTPLCNFINDTYGTSYSRETTKFHNFAQNWNCSEEEALIRTLAFYDSSYHKEGLPLPEAREVLSKLTAHYELHVITARPESTKKSTLELLEKHFPGVFQDIHFTTHYFNKGANKHKGDVCKEVGVCIFVDDAPKHIEDVAGCVEQVFLLDSPWNKKYVPHHENITRIFSWDEIQKHLFE